MSSRSRYYGKGKLVTHKDFPANVIGTIQYADHRNDKYQVMWKKPGGERWIQLHTRMVLKPYGDN